MSTNYPTTSSKPHHSVLPRPYTDASHRMHTYGRLQPLETAARRSSPWCTRIAVISFLLIAAYHVAFGVWHWGR